MPPQPQSPNPDFDFMLKNQQPAKRSLLPNLNLPRPLKITLIAIGSIVVLIILYSLLSGRGSGSTTAIEGVLARGQETLRVTTLVQQLELQDPQTQGLATTVSNSLTSDQVQLKTYLARNHAKVSAAQLAADTDKTTDTSMQTASQNNGLDDAYVSYLRSSLTKYEHDLQNAYKLAGPNGKQLLSDAFNSAQTLLNSPPLKS